MKNKTLTFIFSLIISFAFTSTALIPSTAFAATTKTTSKTTAKKKTTKKKVIKKKSSVDLDPPLITLETAPHSPKPAAKVKKKATTKKTVKKKI